jgi:hypothetical protein
MFVDQLRANSEALQDINAAFIGRTPELELVSYYEGRVHR